MTVTSNGIWKEYSKIKMSNNERHRAFDSVVDSLKNCKDKEELLAITKKANRININFPYSHLPRKMNYGIFLFIYVVIFCFLVSYIYVFLITVGVISFIIYKLSERIDDVCIKWVSKKIYERKTQIEYGIYNIKKSDRNARLVDWKKQFMLFKHGDRDLCLNHVGQISLLDNTNAEFFDFEYKTVSTSGSGNDKSTTVKSHQHYGFIFPFNTDDIEIFSTSLTHNLNASWKTESKEFNRIYRPSAKSQNKAAKILSPVVINLFLDISGTLDNCNFEVSNRVACLSFEDRNFFIKEMKERLSNFDEFYQEIKKTKKSIAIEKVLVFVNELCVRKSTGEGVER